MLAQNNELHPWKHISPTFDSITVILDTISLKDPKAKFLSDQLNELANKTNKPVMQSRSLFWEACIKDEIGIESKDSILQIFNQAQSLNDSVEYLYDFARIKYKVNRINMYYNKADYLESFNATMLISGIFEELGDKQYVALSKIKLAYILREIGEYDHAISYLLSADSLFKSIGDLESSVNNTLNLANLYYLTGYKEAAINLLENSLSQYIKNKDTLLIINAYQSLYVFHDSLKNKDKYVRSAFRLVQHINNDKLLLGVLTNFADHLFEQKKYDSTYLVSKRILHFASSQDINNYKYSSLFLLSKVYAERQQWDSAYITNIESTENYNKIVNAEKISEINKMQTRIAIDKFKDKLTISDLKSQRQKRQNTFTIIFSTIVILFLMVVFRNYRKQSLAKTRIKELENYQLNAKLKNEELQNEKYVLEIDLKNRELSSTSLLLSEKNSILKNTLKIIEKYNMDGSLSDKLMKPVKTLINDNLQNEDEWEMFKIHFEKVHPDFFTALKIKYPALSETELKYCAYIRIGMSAKQIASMLSVMPRTVVTSRFRIRQKLKLETTDSLDEFLRQI